MAPPSGPLAAPPAPGAGCPGCPSGMPPVCRAPRGAPALPPRAGAGRERGGCTAALKVSPQTHTLTGSPQRTPQRPHRVVERLKGPDGILQSLKLDECVAQRADAGGEDGGVGERAKPAGVWVSVCGCRWVRWVGVGAGGGQGRERVTVLSSSAPTGCRTSHLHGGWGWEGTRPRGQYGRLQAPSGTARAGAQGTAGAAAPAVGLACPARRAGSWRWRWARCCQARCAGWARCCFRQSQGPARRACRGGGEGVWSQITPRASSATACPAHSCAACDASTGHNQEMQCRSPGAASPLLCGQSIGIHQAQCPQVDGCLLGGPVLDEQPTVACGGHSGGAG